MASLISWMRGTAEGESRIYEGIDQNLLMLLEQSAREVHLKQLAWLQPSVVTRWQWPRKQIYPIAGEGHLNGSVYSLGDGSLSDLLRWLDEVCVSCQRQAAIGYVSTDRVFVGAPGPERRLVPMLVTMLYVFKPQRRSGYRIEQQLDWTSEGIEILEPTVGKRDRDADEWVWTEGTRYQEFLQSWPKKLGNCGSIHLV